MYIQLAILAFFATQLYILVKIGLKHFSYKDVYKLIFPVYIALHIKDEKSLLNIVVSVIHVSLAVLIVTYFLV